MDEARARFPASGTLDLGVADLGTVGITLVPVTFEGRTPDLHAGYLNQTLQQMPIGSHDIEVRSAYVFSGAFDLDRLLDEMVDLRNLDGSDRLYHGIIVPPPGSSSTTGGIGYVGFPVSVSVDLGGMENIISHEIGHNLNLGHAPACDAPNPDPSFPRADGSVADWGYDILNRRLVNPAGRADLMSYCVDVWSSGYNFARATEHLQGAPIGTSLSSGTAVRGRLRLDGSVELEMLPVDRVRLAHGQQGEYRFQAWDANGQVVATVPFSGYAIQDRPDGVEQGFAFDVALDANEIAAYQIARGTAVLHDARSATPTLPQVSVSRRGGAAALTWQARAHQALVVRDRTGRVMSVDRSGVITLPAASEIGAVEAIHQGRRLSRDLLTHEIR